MILIDLLKKLISEADINYVIIFVILNVIGLFVLYLLIVYLVINYDINKIREFVLQSNTIGKYYTKEPADPAKLEELLLNALHALHTNVNIVSDPYFYTQSLDQILSIFPSYTVVLLYAQYYVNHGDITELNINNLLIKNYGPKYAESPEILSEVTITIMKTRTFTYKRSILIDLNKSINMYNKYKSKIDALLK